jgi:hypothetical protein
LETTGASDRAVARIPPELSELGERATMTGRLSGWEGMMRKLVAAAVVACLAGVSAAPTASAGQGCVTRPEFRRVDVGMRQARVRHIFDTPGQPIQSGPHREEFAYDICAGYQGVVVFVTYRNNRVESKSWLLGE